MALTLTISIDGEQPAHSGSTTHIPVSGSGTSLSGTNQCTRAHWYSSSPNTNERKRKTRPMTRPLGFHSRPSDVNQNYVASRVAIPTGSGETMHQSAAVESITKELDELRSVFGESLDRPDQWNDAPDLSRHPYSELSVNELRNNPDITTDKSSWVQPSAQSLGPDQHPNTLFTGFISCDQLKGRKIWYFSGSNALAVHPPRATKITRGIETIDSTLEGRAVVQGRKRSIFREGTEDLGMKEASQEKRKRRLLDVGCQGEEKPWASSKELWYSRGVTATSTSDSDRGPWTTPSSSSSASALTAHHQNRKNLVDPGECRKAADGLQRDRNVGKAWAMAAQGFRTLGNWFPMLAN
ncbi:hypothetical protein C8R45DRAFT_935137 [Mycena sanguinolenta]|nr:hypothetical protein C8R45DRAFT_935137 [Mycena sanguinolenta]